MDTYRNEPKELDLSQFLRDNWEGNLERFRNAFPKENVKKGK